MHSIVAAFDDFFAAEYLRQLTDAYRVSLFDAIMQFRAIFGSPGDAGGGGGSGGRGGDLAARELQSWVQHRAQVYLDKVEQMLPMCVAVPGPHPVSVRCLPHGDGYMHGCRRGRGKGTRACHSRQHCAFAHVMLCPHVSAGSRTARRSRR
jgi:hypothetical protein